MRILVVDDFEPWRAYLRSLLDKQTDLTIVGEAVDGLEAIEKARDLKPDLVLLDIAMPRLTGIDAIERIREVAPHCKIVVVTVDRSPHIAEAAQERGAQACIPKAEASAKLLPTVEALFPSR